MRLTAHLPRAPWSFSIALALLLAGCMGTGTFTTGPPYTAAAPVRADSMPVLHERIAELVTDYGFEVYADEEQDDRMKKFGIALSVDPQEFTQRGGLRLYAEREYKEGCGPMSVGCKTVDLLAVALDPAESAVSATGWTFYRPMTLDSFYQQPESDTLRMVADSIVRLCGCPSK